MVELINDHEHLLPAELFVPLLILIADYLRWINSKLPRHEFIPLNEQNRINNQFYYENGDINIDIIVSCLDRSMILHTHIVIFLVQLPPSCPHQALEMSFFNLKIFVPLLNL